ncbi:hypothetical protein [Bradyrhizobium sp. AZCC 1699]|uniref:hypothetical protein n=1 Tax=Bradyrhizobium sp. AZCC 1699 TaxID=3117024 RepID=UPI002FEED113
MQRDHELEYRHSDLELHAFLRRSGEIFSDNQPADDQDQGLVVDNQAAIEHALAMLDDAPVSSDGIAKSDVASKLDAPVEPEPSKKHPVTTLVAANKLKRKRRKDAARAKKYRDRKRTIDVEKALDQLDAIPCPPISRAARENYEKRLAALRGATGTHSRQSLVQIRGREEEITTAWQAKASFGGTKVSVAKIAKSYPGKTEWQMRNLLKIVRQLEQPGGPWHGI